MQFSIKVRALYEAYVRFLNFCPRGGAKHYILFITTQAVNQVAIVGEAMGTDHFSTFLRDL